MPFHELHLFLCSHTPSESCSRLGLACRFVAIHQPNSANVMTPANTRGRTQMSSSSDSTTLHRTHKKTPGEKGNHLQKCLGRGDNMLVPRRVTTKGMGFNFDLHVSDRTKRREASAAQSPRIFFANLHGKPPCHTKNIWGVPKMVVPNNHGFS